MKKKKILKRFIKVIVGILVVLLALILWFMNYHMNLVGTTWRCEVWGLIDWNPQNQLKHCYSKLDNWNLPETKDWKIYDRDAYSFVFKVPAAWVADPTGKVAGLNRGIGEAGIGTAWANLSFEEQLSRSKSNNRYATQDGLTTKEVEIRELMIDGRRALRDVTLLHWEGQNVEHIDITYIVDNGKDKSVEFYLTSNGGPVLKDEYIKEFDLMMKTLNLPD